MNEMKLNVIAHPEKPKKDEWLLGGHAKHSPVYCGSQYLCVEI